MDDSVDQCEATAKAIMLFEMTNFEPDMRKIATQSSTVRKFAQRGVALLSDVAKNAAALNEICLQITCIEGDPDDAYDRGLELLYQKAKGGDALGSSAVAKSTNIWRIPSIALTTSLTKFKASLSSTSERDRGPFCDAEFTPCSCPP